MALRKHGLMYQFFGQADGICKDCKHYISYRYHDYMRRKCEIYGITCSEATDWKAGAKACGLYPDKETDSRDIVKLVRGGKSQQEISQIDGQITLNLNGQEGESNEI